MLLRRRRRRRGAAGGFPERVEDWLPEDVGAFLAANGFGEYAAAFVRHRIDGRALLAISSAEMREEIGVRPLEDRKRIAGFTEELRATFGRVSYIATYTVPTRS